MEFYRKFSEISWELKQEVMLLLAEGYKNKGEMEKAIESLDWVMGGETLIYSENLAKASLLKAELQAEALTSKSPEDPQFIALISLLKNLMVQKNIEYEPIHLKASLLYVNLLEKCDENGGISKRLNLLERVKKDFERSDDLLSKDYHLARSKNPKKDQIYRDYLQHIEEEIVKARSMQEMELQIDAPSA